MRKTITILVLAVLLILGCCFAYQQHQEWKRHERDIENLRERMRGTPTPITGYSPLSPTPSPTLPPIPNLEREVEKGKQ